MQTRKSEKSNVELLAFRVTETDPVSRKHRRFFIVIWLVAACLLPGVSAQEPNNTQQTHANLRPPHHAASGRQAPDYREEFARHVSLPAREADTFRVRRDMVSPRHGLRDSAHQ